MAHDASDLAAPQVPLLSSAIRAKNAVERSPSANPSVHAPIAGRAPVEAPPLAPLSQHPPEPCPLALPLAQNAPPQAELSMSAAQPDYNSIVALHGVSGMEVDPDVSDSGSVNGDSIHA